VAEIAPNMLVEREELLKELLRHGHAPSLPDDGPPPGRATKQPCRGSHASTCVVSDRRASAHSERRRTSRRSEQITAVPNSQAFDV